MVTLTNIWIVYPYKYGLFDCSAKVLSLPAHYAEVFYRVVGASSQLVAMYVWAKVILMCFLNLYQMF